MGGAPVFGGRLVCGLLRTRLTVLVPGRLGCACVWVHRRSPICRQLWLWLHGWSWMWRPLNLLERQLSS